MGTFLGILLLVHHLFFIFHLHQSLFDLWLGSAINLIRRKSRGALRLLGVNHLSMLLTLTLDEMVNFIHVQLGGLNVAVDVVVDDLLAWLIRSLLINLFHIELS